MGRKMQNTTTFADRGEAGRRLAAALSAYKADSRALVVGVPRGGVPVAAEVARLLALPLEVMIVRKIGAPGRRELAIGAVGDGDVRILDSDLIRQLQVTVEELESATARAEAEREERDRRFRLDLPPLDLRDRRVILIDDGAATGSSMLAALAVARAMEPSKLVVALPTASRQALERLGEAADEVVCLSSHDPYRAVSDAYQRFPQVHDDEVTALLEAARPPR